MDVTDDRRIVQCFEEQFCIGTWNVRFMNQGKLKVVKQEMARVNINILGIKMISVRFQGKPFNIIVIQVCAPTRNAE